MLRVWPRRGVLAQCLLAAAAGVLMPLELIERLALIHHHGGIATPNTEC